MGTRVSKPAQIAYFERARCLGALAVVLLHVLSIPLVIMSLEAVGQTRAFVWFEAQTVLTRWAVPVFFMITGALLLDPQKHIDWKKSFGYALRMALVLAIFGFGMNVVRAYLVDKSLSLSTLHRALVDTLGNTGWSHLWYVYALIGFYLTLPVIRAFVAQSSRQELKTLLVVLFAFDICVHTINECFGTSFVYLITVSSSLFYFILGYYAHTYLTLDKRVCAAGIASLVAATALAAWYIFGMSVNETWVHSPDFAIISGWSLAVFLFMKRYLNAPLDPSGLVSRFAALSFGVYLFHPLFIQGVYRVLGWGPDTLPPVVFELSVWGIAVVGSAALTWTLRLIPPVRKIL